MKFEKLDYNAYQYAAVEMGDGYRYLCVCPKYKLQDGDEVIVRTASGEEHGIVLDTLYTSDYNEDIYRFFIELLEDGEPLTIVAKIEREDFKYE